MGVPDSGFRFAGLDGTGQPHAQDLLAFSSFHFQAHRRAADLRGIVPGTAPGNPEGLLTAVRPEAGSGWGAGIIRVPGIGAPFPQVAVHIVKAKGVGWKGAHDGGLMAVLPGRFGPVGEFAIVVCQVGGEGIPATKWRSAASPAGVLPLGFGGQAIGQA